MLKSHLSGPWGLADTELLYQEVWVSNGLLTSSHLRYAVHSLYGRPLFSHSLNKLLGWQIKRQMLMKHKEMGTALGGREDVPAQGKPSCPSEQEWLFPCSRWLHSSLFPDDTSSERVLQPSSCLSSPHHTFLYSASCSLPCGSHCQWGWFRRRAG